MNHSESNTLFEGNDIIVTQTSVIWKGERIPVDKIKKAYIDNEKVFFMSYPTYTEFRLEVGMMRRKITIFRCLTSNNICHAARLLARPESLSSGPASDFEYISEKCDIFDKRSIAELRADSKFSPSALMQVEEVLENYKIIKCLESAIHKAMASCS